MQRYGPQTALIVVDMQNDFADPEGSLSVVGGSDIIPTVNEEIEGALGAGAFVAWTQDWHPPSTPHFAKDGGLWPVHCVAGTWGAAFHPALVEPDRRRVVRKGVNGEDGYSGFTMRDPLSGETVPTGLDALLRDHEVRRVVVCGLATDYCVKASAIDAAALGYETALLLDAARAVDLEPDDGDRAVDEMRAAGVAIWQTRMR